MSFYYVTVEDVDGACGVIYCQLDHFNAKRSLNYERNRGRAQNGLKEVIREFVAKRIDFYTLVIGNSTVTGPHGFLFAERIDDDVQMQLVDTTASWIKDFAADAGYDVQLVFVKDFYHHAFSYFQDCTAFPQYNEFRAQPGMQLDLRRNWETFDDYKSALLSKYRVRVRRARKKLGSITCRILTAAEIQELEPQIYGYYRSIADNSVFNLFLLNPNYFSELKDQLGDKFVLWGYFDDSRLVAFSSAIANGQTLEAHFLGYEADTNIDRQLYLNMLLDLVRCGIDQRFESIFFARTALEIKSSIGARPRDMFFYLRHVNGLHNKLLPRIYGILDPKEEWQQRSPFK